MAGVGGQDAEEEFNVAERIGSVGRQGGVGGVKGPNF